MEFYAQHLTAMRSPVAFHMCTFTEKIEPGARPHLVARKEPSWKAAEAQKEFDRRLLQQFAPAAVFVDEALEVVHSRGNVDRYLKLSSGRATLGILKMGREGLSRELRNAIARDRKENVTVRREHVEVKTDHSVRNVTFEVIPLRIANSHELYLMVVFEEAGAEQRRPLGKRGVAPIRKDTPSKRLLKLEQELAATTEYLPTGLQHQEATHHTPHSPHHPTHSTNHPLHTTTAPPTPP